MDLSKIESNIQELEEGFSHLLYGLRTIINDLKNENMMLQARLEEHRLMSGIISNEITASNIERSNNGRKYLLIDKKCEECDNIMKNVRKRRKLCSECVSRRASERMSKIRLVG